MPLENILQTELDPISLQRIPYLGAERLEFKSNQDQATLIFLPRQSEVKVSENFLIRSLDYRCHQETWQLEYGTRQLEFSYISEEDYVINFSLETEAFQLEDSELPIFLDVLTIKLLKPIFQSSNQLDRIISCTTKMITSFRDHAQDSVRIKKAYLEQRFIEERLEILPNGEGNRHTYVGKCSGIKELMVDDRGILTQFIDDLKVEWGFQGVLTLDKEVFAALSFPNLGDEEVSFRDLPQRLRLIFIWATWSVPSREELLENLSPWYQQFNSPDFEIYAISIDTDREEWKNFVGENQLGGIQVIDERGNNSDLIQQLEIKELPASLLIDQEGKLVGRSLRGEALIQFVESYLIE